MYTVYNMFHTLGLPILPPNYQPISDYWIQRASL